VKDLVGFPTDSASRNITTGSGLGMASLSSHTKQSTSGRAGSSFRQKIGKMFRPSSRTKHHQQAQSMASLPMSPGGGVGGSRTMTMSSANQNSNQENTQATNAVK